MNQDVPQYGVEAVVTDQRGYGYWAWLLCGCALVFIGCIWGFAMMLAAGAHRRYINEISRDVRAQIARRIEAMRGRGAHASEG